MVVEDSNSTLTVCECNHLTHFAILLSPGLNVRSSPQTLTLSSSQAVTVLNIVADIRRQCSCSTSDRLHRCDCLPHSTNCNSRDTNLCQVSMATHFSQPSSHERETL